MFWRSYLKSSTLIQRLSFDQVHEYFDNVRVEVCARSLLDVSQSLPGGPGRAVGAVTDQGVPNVNHGKDARGQGYFFSLQAARITGAVPLLVVAIGNVQRRAEITDRQEHLMRKAGVFPHDFPFF